MGVNSFERVANKVNIYRLYNMYARLEITLAEIFDIILKYDIRINIDSTENGLSMISVPEKEVKIKIYEFLIDKLKNSY